MKNYAEQFGYDRRTGKQWAQTGRMLHAPDGRCRTYMQILAVCLMLLFPAKTVYAEETARLQETAEETNTGGESSQTGATGLWQYLQEFGEKTTQSGWSSGEDLWQYLTALGETVRSGEGQGGDFWQHLTGLGEVICSDWMQEEELRSERLRMEPGYRAGTSGCMYGSREHSSVIAGFGMTVSGIILTVRETWLPALRWRFTDIPIPLMKAGPGQKHRGRYSRLPAWHAGGLRILCMSIPGPGFASRSLRIRLCGVRICFLVSLRLIISRVIMIFWL